MDLQRGLPLLIQQFRALLKKNFLLSWRNKRVAFVQLFSFSFIIFLLFFMEKVIDSRFASSTSFQNVYDPKTLVFPPIPPCEDKFYVKLPCFDFAWSGNGSTRIQSIVHSILAKNPGRPIPPSKVKSFRTQDEVDEWLFSNPMHCPGALHFVERNATIISYSVQTNFTSIFKRGHYEDPIFKFQIPLQIAAEREISRSLIGDPNFSWTKGFKEFAHPALEEFSILARVGPTFFFVISLFGFAFQISSLIIEKELKLREAMTMMGLYESAYWLSWLTWEGIIAFTASILFVLFGMMLRFDFFLKNSFVVVVMLFFLFQLNMIGFAFILSTFISKLSSSITVCLAIFFTGYVVQLVTMIGFPYSDNFSYFYLLTWSLFPPNLLAEALNMLVDATATSRESGISWSRRAECASNNLQCVMTMSDIYIWLTTTFFMWLLLAIYLNNIYPNSSGVRRSLLYFLKPGYWTGRGGNKAEEGGCSCIGSIPSEEHITPDDEDVLKEESIIKQQIREGIVDPDIVVQIRGLAKTYSGKTKISFWKCKKTSACHALKGLWVNFPKNKIFSLLGPNGAGKTTTIDCLTGITPATRGDALICGYSIQSSVGMSNIRRIIGVCPQNDILWDDLSGQEHLELFSSIKGLPPALIKSVAQKSLADLRLTEVAKMRAGSYTGGMKRRLSIATAFIGDPKLVILDEPTIGMDGITRKHVWNIIENAKKERAIVLITQSMEEADMLSDRIGIMANGRLRCIGTPVWLKARFGAGFFVHLIFMRNTCPNEDAVARPYQEAVKQFFKLHWDVVPIAEDQALLTFVIPHDTQAQAPLRKFFGELQERQREFGIIEIDMGLSSLEEVFINISKKYGAAEETEGEPSMFRNTILPVRRLSWVAFWACQLLAGQWKNRSYDC